MLQYFRLAQEVQVHQNVVEFVTTTRVRVDISKKFLKKDSTSGRWYFVKGVLNPVAKEMVFSRTFITLGEVYVAECKEPVHEVDANNNPILTVQDIISFQEINTFRGKDNVEETYRG